MDVPGYTADFAHQEENENIPGRVRLLWSIYIGSSNLQYIICHFALGSLCLYLGVSVLEILTDDQHIVLDR